MRITSRFRQMIRDWKRPPPGQFDWKTGGYIDPSREALPENTGDADPD
jgi:hypothetical protein